MPLCLKAILIAAGGTIISYIGSKNSAYWLLIEKNMDINTFLVIGGILLISIFYIFERFIPILNRFTTTKIKEDTLLIIK